MARKGVASGLRSVAAELGLGSVRDGSAADGCRCETSVEGKRLVLEADDCDGDIARTTACRRTAATALGSSECGRIVVRSNGSARRYDGDGVALLNAAARFADRLDDRDERLADAALEDPLRAAVAVRTRTGAAAEVAETTGLVALGRTVESYDAALTPSVGLTIGHSFVDPTVEAGARLRSVRSLETGSEVRIYGRPDGVARYVLDPVEGSLSAAERRRVVFGYEAIADGIVDGERAASKAIERASDGSTAPIEVRVLEKHTRGYGVLEDLFADRRVSDVYLTAPASRNPLRVVVDGEAMATNVSLTADGARALASRVRRTSGRSFSRASPTVDATADLENGTRIRVAGVTEPVTDGVAFAFRERADDRFTLPALVVNGTMSPASAAVLSVAVERNAAALVAGTRGAGKTTLLGTLLYELPPGTRTVLIEDTPELPVESLQSVGRDVQTLRTGTGDGPEITPDDALRTALRLGDGALVVGEIRGEEARVLYEAMRIGASANAVAGTIHGDGADDVYERVVSDLEVPPSSFAATDLIATVQAYRTPAGRDRRLARIEEVVGDDDDVRFEPLYEPIDGRAVSTGRIDRGESRLVNRLAGPGESYADVREAIGARAERLEALAADGRTDPTEVAAAYADRGVE